MSWAGCSKVNLTFKPELFWRNRKDKEESLSESTVILYYQIRRTLIVHDTGKPGLGNQWYQYKELWIIIVISSIPLSNKHVFLLIHKILPLKPSYCVIHFISFGVDVSRYHSEHRESCKTYACVSFIDWFMVISRNPHNASRRCLSYPHHKAARWLNIQTKRIDFDNLRSLTGGQWRSREDFPRVLGFSPPLN